jgi:hypothetical protein
MKSRLLLAMLLCAASVLACADQSPLINQPLIPATVAPGGPDFTLIIHGTGFGRRARPAKN